MNARIASVVTAATLVLTTTGCSGIKNFLFGRGSRCGLCTKLTPPFGNLAPTCGTGTCPSGGSASVAAPMFQPAPVVSSPSCGCGNAIATSPEPCTSCFSGPTEPVCGTDGFGSVSGDPYLYSDGSPVVSSPSVSNSIPSQGGIIGGGVYNDGSSSAWQQRRVDYDGARILSEEPLPAGVSPIR